MAFTFGPGPAINPEDGSLLKGAAGDLYADVAGTIPVTDATINGVPVSSATSDSNAIIPQIQHETVSTLYWVSGSITLALTSFEGLLAAAEAARDSAATSESAAAEAANRTWSYPAPGIMRPPAGDFQIFATKTAALAAGAAIGGFQDGDQVYVENADA